MQCISSQALLDNPSDFKNILSGAGHPVSLDAAHVCYHAVHVVTRLPARHCQIEAGVMFECDCVSFFKQFCCKHVLALGLHLNEIVVPEKYNATWFGDGAGHREPGRPVTAGRKMPPAFVME